jgi:hypothetical protein
VDNRACCQLRVLALGLLVALAASSAYSSPLIIDHTCENLAQIPPAWIDSVQAYMKMHYAHTSHGSQLTTGLSRIEAADPTYSVAIGAQYLPAESGAFCVFDGQEHDTYITPDEYWETEAGMNYTRNVLDNNPTINASMWSWCTQLTYYTEAQTQAYLDSITVLESEYPDVVFIYMTGNAQATGSSGHNRYLRNELIRQYCMANNKVLFDFADLDSWWFNPTTEAWEHSTYEYGGDIVPVEHPQFNGDEAGHTTYESCEQKGRAVWWMMARVAGWEPDPSGVGGKVGTPQVISLAPARPNPFVESTHIEFTLAKGSRASLAVFDIMGRVVSVPAGGGPTGAGIHKLTWDGTDIAGSRLPSGVYYIRLSAPGAGDRTRKVILLR